jgi:hypothetical protein
MSDDPNESPLKLESYSLERVSLSDAESSPALVAPATPIRITLRGQCFKVTARDPKITIGNVQLMDYEIMPDECTIIGYLYEQPEEGSVISIEYDPNTRAELSELFSLSKLPGEKRTL